MTLAERVAVIEACRYVDEVVVDAPLCLTEEFLLEQDIAVVVHGDGLSPEHAEVVYGPAVRSGRLRYVARTGAISPTEPIRPVLDVGRTNRSYGSRSPSGEPATFSLGRMVAQPPSRRGDRPAGRPA